MTKPTRKQMEEDLWLHANFSETRFGENDRSRNRGVLATPAIGVSDAEGRTRMIPQSRLTHSFRLVEWALKFVATKRPDYQTIVVERARVSHRLGDHHIIN